MTLAEINGGIVENPWFMAFLGWVIYNLWLLQRDQKKFDKDGNGYSLAEVSKYVKYNSISIMISFLLIFVGVPYANEIWYLITPEGTEFLQIAYFGVGAMSIVVQIGLKWLNNKARGNE